MGSQQFCLRWNNHQVNLLSVFESLLQNEALVDVTLACEGLTLKAHKVVLSACSPYFQQLFLENPCKHPIVILKDVRYSDLKALIDFMYRGQVNVEQDQLNNLLHTAETLKVKGLAEVTGGGGVVSCTSATIEASPVSGATTPTTVRSSVVSLTGTPTINTGPSAASSPPPAMPPMPPGLPLSERKLSQLPPPPSLQPLANAHNVPYLPTSSPPPKRRKTKPRKRIPETAMMSSDQEDSDALDLVTTTPDIVEGHDPTESAEGDHRNNNTNLEPTESKAGLLLTTDIHHNKNSPPPHHYRSSASLEPPAKDPEDTNSNTGEKPFTPSSNQNQYSAAAAAAAAIAASIPPSLAAAVQQHTQRLQMLSKQQSQSMSVLPPSMTSSTSTSSSPLPSTSTTQASIQDIRRLCQFTRQSQKHKSPWTEEDMVAALEAVQCGRLTYALAARKFDIPKATLHYYVILMKAVEAVRSGRMTPEIAAIKYNVRASILIGCLYGGDGSRPTGNSSPPLPQQQMPPPSQHVGQSDRNDVFKKEV